MNWETYLAFGDSITIGARSYLGYPEWTGHLLAEKLSKEWHIINHAVSGYQAIDLARYIDSHYADLQAHQASISSILIGTNDVKKNVSVENYGIALNQVIIKAKLLTESRRVLLFEIPHFPQGIMYPYQIEMNETIKAYNLCIARLAEKHGLSCIKLNLDAKDFYDGVHLNEEGIRTVGHQIASLILQERGMDFG